MKLEVTLEKRLEHFTFAVSFSVVGRLVGVFGPSGSGKSTFMHMLAGLLEPDRGVIRLDDDTLFDGAGGINRAPEKRRIGVVFQHSHLFPHMSVRRNLFYGYKRIPGKERKIDPKTLIEVLNIGPLLDRGVNSLSGGERQRVALGRTVLCSPRLILMDEPLTGLDEELKYQIIPYLKKVFAEFDLPLIFISHSLEEMRLMTDQVLEFGRGRLRAQTSPHELALRRLGTSVTGYMNMLELHAPRRRHGLFAYRWGTRELILSTGGETGGVFQLSSKDVILCKRHPEATSACNMLRGIVKKVLPADDTVGVELDCNGQHLVAQIVPAAVRDLDLSPGNQVIAVIQASAFRRLY